MDRGNYSVLEVSSISGRTLAETISYGVLIALVALLTIFGNLLVCVTIMTIRKLRTATNLFILSLSVTDLLVGCLVLPLSAVNTLMPYWPFGPVFCNIFTSSDVLLCTASILNLFAISIDRYIAVTKPLRYESILTGRKVVLLVAAIWILSFLISFVPLHLGWNTEDGSVQNYADPYRCTLEGNKPYVLFVAIGTYFTPLIVMCCFYLRIFVICRNQVKQINMLVSAIHNLAERRKSSQQLATERKATVTLASVLLAFSICWVPYFVIFCIRPFLQGRVNQHLDLFALWLGYVNSMLNPILYAFCNTEFRNGFKKVLCNSHLCGGNANEFTETSYV